MDLAEGESNGEGSYFHCCCFITHEHFQIDDKPVIQIIISILNIPTSITATLGNLLVLVSIWRNPSLHSPSNFLLFSLALSDVSVGLVVQPIFLTVTIAKITRLADVFCRSTVALGIAGNCFCGVSLLTLTVISLDRYVALHLHLRYNELVTEKRVTAVLVCVWLVAFLFGASYPWSSAYIDYFSIAIIFLCLSVITFAYYKIYRVVHHHQVMIDAQAQAETSQQEANSPSMPQYKKSFWNMLLIYCLFLLCYTPYLVLRAVLITTGETVPKRSALEFVSLVMFLNSTVNPLVYCWRFEQIRATVTKTINDLLCWKGSAQ